MPFTYRYILNGLHTHARRSTWTEDRRHELLFRSRILGKRWQRGFIPRGRSVGERRRRGLCGLALLRRRPRPWSRDGYLLAATLSKTLVSLRPWPLSTRPTTGPQRL